MDKYLPTRKAFWGECTKLSLKASFNIFLAIATVIGVIFFVVAQFFSVWSGLLTTLAWAIPLGAFVVVFIVSMTRFPHTLYKYQADKVREYETQAIELEENCRLESLQGVGNVWVARVGVRALGQRVVRGVFVYLRYIDDNQNDFFDAPLHPVGQMRNATGAINVNPGVTQRFIEVLHWNTSANEMGIPYNLTYQLREAGVDIHTSRDSIPDRVDVGTHILTLYATGEDIKPIERIFKVDIVNGRLEMHGINNEQ